MMGLASGSPNGLVFSGKSWRIIFVVLLIIAVGAGLGAPAATAALQKQPAALAPGGASGSLRQEEWQKLVAAAKKEGKLILYGDSPAIQGPLAETFLKKYGVTIEMVIARPTQVAEKLQRERRAGIFQADAVFGGSDSLVGIIKPLGILDSLEPKLLLPELTVPEQIQKVWWRGKLFWNDDAHTSLSFMASPVTYLAINTEIVKPAISSFRDLLDPKWKGKLIFQDPTAGGGGFRPFAAVGGAFMGWDFWREVMAKQEPAFTRDARLQVEWMARGKSAIAFAPKTETVTTFVDNGAPVEFVVPKEGVHVASGAGGVALLTQAAHPNATRLFLNFLLSQEGQTLYSQAANMQSARLDVRVDHLHPAKVRKAGGNFLVPEGDKYFEQERGWKKMVDEIVKPLLK